MKNAVPRKIIFFFYDLLNFVFRSAVDLFFTEMCWTLIYSRTIFLSLFTKKLFYKLKMIFVFEWYYYFTVEQPGKQLHKHDGYLFIKESSWSVLPTVVFRNQRWAFGVHDSWHWCPNKERSNSLFPVSFIIVPVRCCEWVENFFSSALASVNFELW